MSTSIHVEPFLDSDSETFSYVVADLDAKLAVVIDPVLDFDYKSGRTSTQTADKILSFVSDKDLTVTWVLETHAHADHLSAAPFIKRHTGAQIAIGEHIREVQGIFKKVFNLEKEFLPNGEQFDRLLVDGDVLTVGAMHFRVMHTPGHTPADLAYILNEQRVFVGDTLFMPDVGTARCDFPGGSAASLYSSIQTLLSMPDDTQLFMCHDYPPEGREHEYITTVGEQKRHNIHVHEGVTEEAFVQLREARDRTLAMPRLILPAIQVNIRAGHLPPAEDNGTVYLKVPINAL